MDDTDQSPTEQQNHEPSAEAVSSAATDELTDELHTLELQTSDGWFEAEITQIVPTDEGDQLAMTAMIDTGDMVTWHLDKPELWTDEYLFVRLADQYDYGASAINLLVGEILPIRPETGAADAAIDTTGTWELQDPGQAGPLPTQVVKIGSILTDTFFSIFLLGLFFVPIIAIALFALPEGLIEQVIYFGVLLVWLLASIGLAMSPDVEPSSDESDFESSSEESE